MERISLTAFFPAYNDQHTIENIVRTAADEMRKVTNDFEVLVVDDGSKDKTADILDRLAAELPFLRVIHHERNLGYGAALISGFKNAKKDLIFYTDGDGQYDVREMHNLLAQLKPNSRPRQWLQSKTRGCMVSRLDRRYLSAQRCDSFSSCNSRCRLRFPPLPPSYLRNDLFRVQKWCYLC